MAPLSSLPPPFPPLLPAGQVQFVRLRCWLELPALLAFDASNLGPNSCSLHQFANDDPAFQPPNPRVSTKNFLLLLWSPPRCYESLIDITSGQSALPPASTKTLDRKSVGDPIILYLHHSRTRSVPIVCVPRTPPSPPLLEPKVFVPTTRLPFISARHG